MKIKIRNDFNMYDKEFNGKVLNVEINAHTQEAYYKKNGGHIIFPSKSYDMYESEPIEKDKVLKYNLDQIDHIQRLQKSILEFTGRLLSQAIIHDMSKFGDKEYFGFIDSLDSLRNSKDGFDKEYQKHLKSDAIQHHIKNNKHHPEYWTKRNKKMPLDQIIIMFFDWKSRCDAKKTTLEDFWEFNIAKLRKSQKHAIPVVSILRQMYEPDYAMWP